MIRRPWVSLKLHPFNRRVIINNTTDSHNGQKLLPKDKRMSFLSHLSFFGSKVLKISSRLGGAMIGL